MVNGEDRELFKDPVTDNGTKKSAKGLLRVEYKVSIFVFYDQQTRKQEKQGMLRTVFLNGITQNMESVNTSRIRLANF